MKVTAKIGDCAINIDDIDAAEPTTGRWKDQFERIKETIAEAQKAVIALHEQQLKDT